MGKNVRRFWLSLPLLLGSLACSKSQSDAGAAAAADFDSRARASRHSEHPISDPVCPIVFETSSVLRAQQDPGPAQLGYRLQSPEVELQCANIDGTIRKGYAHLYIYPQIEALDDFEIENEAGLDGSHSARLLFRWKSLSDQEKKALIAHFEGKGEPFNLYDAFIVREPEPSFAIIPGLPNLPVKIARGHLSLRIPHSFLPVFREYSAQFSAGREILSVYSSTAALNNRRALLNWRVPRPKGQEAPGQFEQPLLPMIQQLWSQAVQRGSPQEMIHVIADAGSWLTQLGYPLTESSTNLSELVAFSRAAWTPTPSRAAIRPETVGDLLTHLRFIMAVNPGAVPLGQLYAEHFSKLARFFPAHAESALAEAIRLVDEHPYSAEQEVTVFRFAYRLFETSTVDLARIWEESKDVGTRTVFDAQRLSLLLSASLWLRTVPATREPYELAKKYTLELGLTALKLQTLKQTYATLLMTQPSAAALAGAEKKAFSLH